MKVNASVFVRNGDIDKALKALKKKLEKQGLLGYDPEKRRNKDGKKRKKGKKENQ
ncbi:MAG: hypothetical protein PHQ42_03885 [Patescibacteria group bacterium]|nr:hypothetical protein [Patescibacteria group bacterium]